MFYITLNETSVIFTDFGNIVFLVILPISVMLSCITLFSKVSKQFYKQYTDKKAIYFRKYKISRYL